jgi:hypothetical protein
MLVDVRAVALLRAELCEDDASSLTTFRHNARFLVDFAIIR